MSKNVANRQRQHLPAAIFAAFNRPFQIMAGELDGHGIRNYPAGALLVLPPSRMRQGQPYGMTGSQELNVHGVGMTRRDGHDQGLKGAMHALSGPTVDGVEIVVHGESNTI